jgi:hypothetical protein
LRVWAGFLRFSGVGRGSSKSGKIVIFGQNRGFGDGLDLSLNVKNHANFRSFFAKRGGHFRAFREPIYTILSAALAYVQLDRVLRARATFSAFRAVFFGFPGPIFGVLFEVKFEGFGGCLFLCVLTKFFLFCYVNFYFFIKIFIFCVKFCEILRKKWGLF